MDTCARERLEVSRARHVHRRRFVVFTFESHWSLSVGVCRRVLLKMLLRGETPYSLSCAGSDRIQKFLLVQHGLLVQEVSATDTALLVELLLAVSFGRTRSPFLNPASSLLCACCRFVAVH